MLTMFTALEVTPVVLYGKFSNARVCEYLKYLFSLISTSMGKFLTEQLDEYKKQVEAHDQAFAEIVKKPTAASDKICDLKKDMLMTEAKFNRKWLRFVKIYREYLKSNIELGLPVENCPASMIYQDFPSLLAKTQAKTLSVYVLCDHILERYDFKTDKRICRVLCEVEKETKWRKKDPIVKQSDQKPSHVNEDVTSDTSHTTGSQSVSTERIDHVKQEDKAVDIQSGQDTLNNIAVLFLANHGYDSRLAVFKEAIEPGQCLPKCQTGLNEKCARAVKRKVFESSEMPELENKQARTSLYNNATLKAEQPADRPGMIHGHAANMPNTSGTQFIEDAQAKQQRGSYNVVAFKHNFINDWQQHWVPPMPLADNVPRFGQWKPNEKHQLNRMAAPGNAHMPDPWNSTCPYNGQLFQGNQTVGNQNQTITDMCQPGLKATHTYFKRFCPRGQTNGFNAYRAQSPVGCLTNAVDQSSQSGRIY